MISRYILVPLASDTFFDEELGIPSLQLVNRVPLFVEALKKRPWASAERDCHIFILRAADHIDIFIRFLREHFPQALFIVLPHAAPGSLLNTLAGLSCISDYTAPIAVDFADLIFTGAVQDPFEIMSQDRSVAGVIPYWVTSAPGPGDLQVNNGVVQWASEGEAISPFLTVGVFVFRNLRALLKAAALTTFREPRTSHRPVFSICDSLNTLMTNRSKVLGCEVSDVRIAEDLQPRSRRAARDRVSIPGDAEPKPVPAGHILPPLRKYG